MRYIYTVASSDIYSGQPHQIYYCKSKKDAEKLLNKIIKVNGGFDVSEVELSGWMRIDGFIASYNYFWNNHHNGGNPEQPQRNVHSNISIKKHQIMYT